MAEPRPVTVLQSAALRGLFTKIRDQRTEPREFAFYADRLMRILAEEGLAARPGAEVEITTPTACPFAGVEYTDSFCAVSIVRAGDSLLDAVRACEPGVAVGKILIQRDEETAMPRMFYSKLPPTIAQMDCVMLVDPMLATGGSAKMAIQTLLEAGVEEAKIQFLNVVACPEGVAALQEAYPAVHIVTACIDDGLNDRRYILPGLGDYGDRYFNT